MVKREQQKPASHVIVFVIGDTININLSSLNSSDNVYKTYKILQGSAEFSIEDIPFDYGYLLIQVHSFKNAVSLSNNSDFDPDTYVNGTNIGLIYIKEWGTLPRYYLQGDPNINITILLVVVGHNIKGKIIYEVNHKLILFYIDKDCKYRT